MTEFPIYSERFNSHSKSMASTSSESTPSSPSETPTINNSTESKPLENADQKGKKPLENNHHNAASSSGITDEDESDDNHGGALSLSSEMIQKDLVLLDLALMKYMHHTYGKINQAHEKFKEQVKLPSVRDFDEVRRAIRKLEDQIPSLENNHHNVASRSGTTNEDDNHGGALSHFSEMIQKDLLHLDSALMKYMHHTNEKINQAREKFKELLKLPSSERNFDEARRAIRKLEDKIPSLENNHDNAASSSGTTNEDDNHGGAHSHSSEMIQKDLFLLDLALIGYMHHTNGKINQAHKKFKELPKLSSSEKDHFDEVRKAITKLKGQIPSRRSSYSKPQHREWPNINKAKEEMRHFSCKEPEVKQTVERKLAFDELPSTSRCCLLCFFRLPPEEFVKRTTMIYLWICQGFISEPDDGKKIFDELIAKNFIKRCSSVPNSCTMSLSVRSSLHKEAEDHGFTSNGALDNQNIANVCGNCLAGNSCLINKDEAIINNKLIIFENVENIRSLHLGRWQSSVNHHIELEDIKILDEILKNLKWLKFLSLRGISLIKELPKSILELNDLKILDLRACQNLVVIPKNISLLKNLTHLDMSECYFLEHMPESLAQLSNLEVLKGFFIGHVKNKNQLCTLHDLSKLRKLRKLNIYTSVKEFPTMLDLDDLQEFEGLLKLTISWGGFSLQVDHQTQTRRKLQEKIDGRTAALKRVPVPSPPEFLHTLHLRLQKLDLQGFPMKNLPHWLRPANLKELKKLYIRGGNLCNVGQLQERTREEWKVEILRLKYLSELEIDWSQLRLLFPELIYLQQLECPKLTSFPVNESGVWMDEEAIDTLFWLQKFFKSDGVSLSSLLGYAMVQT